MAKKRKRRKPRRNNRTTINEHRRVGSKLVPPLARLPSMNLASWRNQRLPEMLWAVVLFGHLSRSDALDNIRNLADFIAENRKPKPIDDVRLTGISLIDSELRNKFIGILCDSNNNRELLRSLLLLEDLPSKKAWQDIIQEKPTQDDWYTLMSAVGKSLWHQSRESTDCRWTRIYCKMASGELKFADSQEEAAKEILF